MIVVTAKEKCRKAGIDFKKGETKFKHGELSAAKIAQIEADPRLSIALVNEKEKGDSHAQK